MSKKIITTLCLITANSQVLLGMKKRGFGAGRWNGFGGKVHDGEGIIESVVREVLEECSLTIQNPKPRGLLNFSFENGQGDIEMHLFEVTQFAGEPIESEEMRPQWFYANELPFDKMWPDDRFWFPYFLDRKNFTGKFFFKDNDHLLDYEIKETNSLK